MRPKSGTFSFFRRSRHIKITPSRLSTPGSGRKRYDNITDKLEKQNTKDSLNIRGPRFKFCLVPYNYRKLDNLFTKFSYVVAMNNVMSADLLYYF